MWYRSLYWRIALGFIAATPLAACMVGDTTATLNDDLTFEEFRELTFQEPWEGGAYIIDGDTPVANEKALYEEWLALYGGQALIVNTSGSMDTVWSPTQKLNLTYCVSQSSFGSRYAAVVSAMDSATAPVESTSAAQMRRCFAPQPNCTRLPSVRRR